MKAPWLIIMPLTCALATTVGAQDTATSTARPGGAPAADGPPAPVEVHTSVSRTAVWVGDPVTYLVELYCAPKVEILTDDLAAERLPLEGLEILGLDVERDESVPDRVIHRIRYRLVAYDLDRPTLSVGAIPVRYYIQRPGLRPEDMVPAGEARVPPLTLALRSTIPEGGTAALRDDRRVQPLPRWVRLAKPVGIALVVLAVAPVALWGADLVRRARRARSGTRIRLTRKQRRAELEEIKALDISSTTALREAYTRLDAWVRASLSQATGVAAVALTPAEIEAAVTRPPRALQMAQIQEVLLECERAKYAPEPPSADRWPTALVQAEQMMGPDGR